MGGAASTVGYFGAPGTEAADLQETEKLLFARSLAGERAIPAPRMLLCALEVRAVRSPDQHLQRILQEL
jgi:hypothetical protein